jgi:uncharacterized OB-fold protein
MIEFTVQAYKDFLQEGRLMGSRCESCRTIYLPPRPVCPECHSRKLDWLEMSGDGTLEAYTVIAVPLSILAEEAPYAVGVVNLDEGPNVSGIILDVKEGEALKVGARVKAEFKKGEDRAALFFRVT